MVELVPITDGIGIEVKGIDVTRSISSADFDRIYDAWIENTILLFRDQSLTPTQHVEFTRRFGEVVTYTRQVFAEGDRPEILVLSNIANDGRLIGSPVSGRVWHSDGHYLSAPPAGSMLYAIETPPEGGDTLFANMFAAYKSLPEALKLRIATLQVVISRVQSRPYNYPERGPATEEQRREWLDVPQPMVLTHSESGRKALYVGGNVPWRIVGLDDRHKWRPGDIILWDNRSAMHHATYYDGERYRRLLHRTTLTDKRSH
jgi:taurine dioxygenase/putative 2-oxoglutarate oxygenase